MTTFPLTPTPGQTTTDGKYRWTGFAWARNTPLDTSLVGYTIDAAVNTITGIALSMFATNVVDIDGTLFANSDTRIASQKATKTYVASQIAAVVNGAPALLSTLLQIAAAINNDPVYSATISAALATKATLASPTFTGIPSAPTATPGTNTTQLATTAYVATAISGGLPGTIGVTIQGWDADLDAIAALGSTGFAARTAANTWAQRSLTAPAAGFTITNPAGIAGNPTFALANDLAALEALTGTNVVPYRTGTDAWATTPTTAYGRSFLNVADQAAGRALLGLQSDSLVYNIVTYGAVSGGVFDCKTAIDAAFAAAALTGGIVWIPPGKFLDSTTGRVRDYTTSTDAGADLKRVSVKGTGQFSSRITAPSASVWLSTRGGNISGTGNLVGIADEDFMLIGPGTTGVGLEYKVTPYCSINRTYLAGWLLAGAFEDADFFRMDSNNWRFNVNGLYAHQKDVPTSYSTQPNSWVLTRNNFGVNSGYGAWIVGAAALNLVGNEFGNNGYSALPNRWGLRLTNCAFQGGTGLVAQGNYFEDNVGSAQLWLEMTSACTTNINPAAHLLAGNSFNRTGLGFDLGYGNAPYNVLVQFHPNAGTQRLVAIANGFKTYGTYVPDAARKDIYFDPAFASANYYNFVRQGNVSQSALENFTEPTWIGTQTTMAGPIVAANTVDLGATAADRVLISTSGTPIASFGTTPNQYRLLMFTGAVTVNHSASIKVKGLANHAFGNGEWAIATSDDSGNYYLLF